MGQFARPLLATTALLTLAGCASSIAYRADYVPATAVNVEEKIAGRVLI